MLAGAAELGLAAGKLRSPWWRLTSSLAMLVSGAAFLVHEQQHWLFNRAAWLHHALGWTLVVGAVFPLFRVRRPQSPLALAGFAGVLLVVAVFLFADRDTASIFGHLSTDAGIPHR
jgi:peptidoglycan/LPS O-acetylase OafA/YrhL